MRIIGIYIIDVSTKKFVGVKNLGFVNMLSRGSVEELMTTFACHVAERIEDGERKLLEHDDFCFVCLKRAPTAVVCITDKEYPSRVAFGLVDTLHADPCQQRAQHVLDTCQDARQVSQLYNIRASLDETMVIMHQTVDKVLARGEKLNDLVERSAQLSASSKMFYKTARRHNRCCSIS